jgi:hypothetical protein
VTTVAAPPAAETPAPPAPPVPNLKLALDEYEPPNGPSGASAPPAAPVPEREPPQRPAGQEEDGLRPCPYCGEPLRKEAQRCRHCGEDLSEDDARPWERRSRYAGVRRDCEPHRGTLILVLGIIGIVALMVCAPLGLPLAVAAWVMGQRDLKKMTAGVMDPQGRGLTQAGWICGIIGTIIDGLMSIGCVAYVGFIFYMIWWESQQAAQRRNFTPAPATKPVRKMQVEGFPLRLTDYLPYGGGR